MVPRPNLARWVKHASLALLLIALFVYVSAFLLGSGAISQFSPDTLDCRTRTELVMPVTAIPIYRGPHRHHRYELVDYLIAHGYWSARPTDAPRWLSAFHWNQQWKDGQSNLHRELAWSGEAWIQWSKDHPQIAARYWPLLLTALREQPPEKYGALLFWPRLTTSLEEFEEVLKRATLDVP